MSGTGSAIFGQHEGIPYLDFLSLVNQHLAPRSYFEIGTNTGSSIERFSCDAICVDPNFLVERNVWTQRRRSFLFQMTSDDFFRDENLRHYVPAGPDVSFLDGMHLFEFLLRDFMNVERLSHPASLVFLHDCLPLSVRMAERAYVGGAVDEGEFQWAWTGDVWKILHAFRRFRPDLKISFVDCPPTGLVAVSNLDPSSTVFVREYDRVIAEIGSLGLDQAGLAGLRSMYPTVSSRACAAAPGLLQATMRCR